MFAGYNFFIYLYKTITERMNKLKNQEQLKLNTQIKLITENFYYFSCINFSTSDEIAVIILEIEDKSADYRSKDIVLVYCNTNDRRLYLVKIFLIYFTYMLFYYILFFSYSNYS